MGDASFKTFCTPLRRPFPVAVVAGEKVRQAVRLKIEGAPAVTTAAGSAAGVVRIEPINAPRTRLPALGLATASHGQALTEQEITRLRALRPAHLRVELRPAVDDCAARLRAASVMDIPLEMALFFGGNPVQDLQALAVAMRRVRPLVARWQVFRVTELSATGTRWVDLARMHLAGFGPAAFVTGTDYWFAQLNRERPPLKGIDGVCFTLTPQVHASDHASLVETLAMHAGLVASAREFCDPLPLIVSPVTLRMRNNPAATGPERPTPPGELPARVDPRQLSLFGAGWTLGSVKHLAEAGVASTTYYETTGWLGVMETENGSPSAELFPSIPGAVFPLYHVLADLNEFTGSEVVPCISSAPLQVEALVLARENARRVLVANLTPFPQVIELAKNLGWGSDGTVRRLHPANAVFAMTAPEEFRRMTAPVTAAGRFELAPFEVLTLDVPLAAT